MGAKTWGYVRVSKASDQSPDRQLDLLMREYCIPREDIFVDRYTGTKFDRPALSELQKVLREGDKIVVESLSRVSRKSSDLFALLDTWHENGVSLKSHKENLDLSNSATGRLMLALFAALAQFERDNLVERTLEGVAAARERGRVGGRPKTDKKALEKALKLYSAKTHSIREICQFTHISKSVLYRELQCRRELAQSDGDSDGAVSEE
ncbi:recombinase family protein [Alicyclobacillus curvatus]|nr:recombinase family protein [Alicyclobacillus curvatus]